jgi:YggT family protein
MFVLGYFIKGIAVVLNLLISFYMFAIIVQAVLSWVSPDPYNPVVRFLYSITEPVYRPLRRRLPLFYGGIDFSPMLVIIILIFLREFLVNVLLTFAGTLIK